MKQTIQQWIKAHPKTILFLLIAMQLALITTRFAIEKTGYHVDELWQYTISNSSKGYGIIMNSTRDSYAVNLGRWMDQKELNDFFTVQKDERLDFHSVWENAAKDTKGPFGYVPLHFVSGFTPDVFSKWQMFLVNAVSFLLIQIYLFRLAFLYSKSRKMAMLTTGYFGYTLAALNTVIFLRLYAMEAAILIMYVFYTARFFTAHRKKEIAEEPQKWSTLLREVLPFLFLHFLGTLTDYLYMIFAFVLTGCICVYLLCNKKFRVLLYYALSSLAGAFLMFRAYPAALDQMLDFSDGSGVWYRARDLRFSFRIFNTFLWRDLLGIKRTYFYSMTENYIRWGFLALLFLCLLLRVLFRDEWKKHALGERLRAWGKVFVGRHTHNLYLDVSLLFSAVVVMFMTARRIDLYAMGSYADRYLMPFFPLFALFLVRFVRLVFAELGNVCKRVPLLFYNILPIVCLVLFALCGQIFWTSDFSYFFRDLAWEEVKLGDIAEDADIVVLFDAAGDAMQAVRQAEHAHSMWFHMEPYFASFPKEALPEGDRPLYLVMGAGPLEEYYEGENIFFDVLTVDDKTERILSEKEILRHFENLTHRTPEKVGLTHLWEYKSVVYRLR